LWVVPKPLDSKSAGPWAAIPSQDGNCHRRFVITASRSASDLQKICELALRIGFEQRFELHTRQCLLVLSEQSRAGRIRGNDPSFLVEEQNRRIMTDRDFGSRF
jgi:hypothetical protein